jgi:hypothetical protein
MKTFVRAASLWLTLAGASWLLLQPETPHFTSIIWGFARLFVLPLAVVLTWSAALTLPPSRLWQWSFGTVTLAGWLTVAWLMNARLETRLSGDDEKVLTVALAGATIAALWIAMRGIVNYLAHAAFRLISKPSEVKLARVSR